MIHLTYLIPPENERKGGIDTALKGLQAALERTGEVEIALADSIDGTTDIAHFHGMWQTEQRAAYRHCREKKVPYVVSPHGMLEPWAWKQKRWKKLPYFHLVEKPQLRGASSVFSTSPLEANGINQLIPDLPVTTLPFGIDEEIPGDHQSARDALGVDADTRLILYLSRIDKKKGLDLLLTALAETDTTNCKLLVVGDGDETFSNTVENFAKEHANELPPIEWLGPVWGADRWKFLHAADLFCLPTHSENFGFAVLEALWVGTPVLTTDKTPWPAYTDGQPGTHMCSDTPDSVTECLTKALASPPWSESQREKLLSWTRKNFHWDALALRYIEAYKSLIQA